MLDYQVIQFGEFLTKSQRKTPYFINSSQLYYGQGWLDMMDDYVQTAHDIWYEQIQGVFGAAYKGIPLCTSFAEIWHQKTQHNIPFAFSRKETKHHGEKGSMVGSLSKLADNLEPTPPAILVCDDVLTSGLSLRESLLSLQEKNLTILGALVVVDRQEYHIGDKSISAKQGIQQEFQVPVHSLINLDEIIKYLELSGDPLLLQHLDAMTQYRSQYGVSYQS